MTHLVLLLVVAANHGYWLGGHHCPVTLQWNLEGQPEPASVLTWEIRFGQVTTAAGKATLRDDKMPLTIDVPAPKVRVRTDMVLTYRVTSADAKREVLAASLPLVLFPDNQLDGLANTLKDRRVVVVDSRPELADLLDHAQVAITRLSDPALLGMAPADVVVVGVDQITQTPMVQARFEGYARQGSTVILFSQSRVPRLMGYALVQRPLPAAGSGRLSPPPGSGLGEGADVALSGGLAWRVDHPLLNGVDAHHRESWLEGAGAGGGGGGASSTVLAIQLPADEPALEVAFWPRETPGKDPVPIDALLVVKSVGKGRLVLCQLPLGPWATDPRSQVFLRNALDYTLTRPEPTLPPSQRPTPQVRQARPERDILDPIGTQP